MSAAETHAHENEESIGSDDHSHGEQNMMSASTPRGELVHEPKPMDIICGRGSRITHPGNKRFRLIVL